MPVCENKVPVFEPKVPGKCPNCENQVPKCGTNVPRCEKNGASQHTEGINSMPNTKIADIDLFVREHIFDIMRFVQAKCDEKNITNDELMSVTKIAHSSFYRLWRCGRPEEELTDEDKKPFKPNADHVCRMCLALGVSLDEFQRTPTAESVVFLPALPEDSHSEIMDNLWNEISGLRDTIAQLEDENAALKSENKRLMNVALSREEDIRSNIMRINKLTDALIERHDQMHDINRTHYEHLYTIFSRILDSDAKPSKE